MYFPLEINCQLVNAMRAAAEFKVEVEKIIKVTCNENEGISISQEDFKEMSQGICDMIVQIGNVMGAQLADVAIDEVRKASLS